MFGLKIADWRPAEVAVPSDDEPCGGERGRPQRKNFQAADRLRDEVFKDL